MKIHEYQGKELLKKFGVPVPRGIVARTPDEAFNAANHPNWGNPGTGQPKEIRADGSVVAANANFGKITGMRGAMRQLQFGLKFIF